MTNLPQPPPKPDLIRQVINWHHTAPHQRLRDGILIGACTVIAYLMGVR